MIELMIVVAIIGILAAIAVPTFQEYTARAQASEGLQLLAGLKAPLAEYYADKGAWPLTPDEMGLNTSGKFVLSSASFVTGAGSVEPQLTIVATFRDAGVNRNIAGKMLVLETVDGGKLWTCRRHDSANGISNKYLPKACW